MLTHIATLIGLFAYDGCVSLTYFPSGNRSSRQEEEEDHDTRRRFVVHSEQRVGRDGSDRKGVFDTDP